MLLLGFYTFSHLGNVKKFSVDLDQQLVIKMIQNHILSNIPCNLNQEDPKVVCETASQLIFGDWEVVCNEESGNFYIRSHKKKNKLFFFKKGTKGITLFKNYHTCNGAHMCEEDEIYIGIEGTKNPCVKHHLSLNVVKETNFCDSEKGLFPRGVIEKENTTDSQLPHCELRPWTQCLECACQMKGNHHCATSCPSGVQSEEVDNYQLALCSESKIPFMKNASGVCEEVILNALPSGGPIPVAPHWPCPMRPTPPTPLTVINNP